VQREVQTMRILPVLDLQAGLVVRGVGGRRAEYRPLVSPLCPTSAPLDVARAFREHFGLTELYLADLDAILGGAPALETYTLLHADGFQTWVDAGLNGPERADEIARAGVPRLIAGLETLPSPEALAGVLARHTNVVFSLDLRAGIPQASAPWPRDPWAIVTCILSLGVRHLLLLDLTRVGEARGPGTEDLCARIAAHAPEVELAAGGGIRGPADLQRLRTCGVQVALVASALHEGWLTAEEVEEEYEPQRARRAQRKNQREQESSGETLDEPFDAFAQDLDVEVDE
jgi:phosphoribosylformimino-5-aminoimidazole carboxamide ribotide isomerase